MVESPSLSRNHREASPSPAEPGSPAVAWAGAEKIPPPGRRAARGGHAALAKRRGGAYYYRLMANTPVINLRKGHAVRHNGDVCIVTATELKTPPRMASYVQMSIRSIASGRVHNLRMTSNESLDSVNLNRQEYEYSYIDGEGYHFMHPETFEDVVVSNALIEPVKDYILEGKKYTLLFADEKVATLELPASMVLAVVESAEGLKGDSSTNVFKPAKLETGLTVQVPLFIKEGDKISVKTEDGSYLGRSN